jgi:hypothetical protein
MTFNIDDDMIRLETTGAVSKLVCAKIHDLFEIKYNNKGNGYSTVEKIIDNYIVTKEFHDYIMGEMKQMLAPTIKEVLQALLTKKIKKYIDEEKINNPDLFNEKEGK